MGLLNISLTKKYCGSCNSDNQVNNRLPKLLMCCCHQPCLQIAFIIIEMDIDHDCFWLFQVIWETMITGKYQRFGGTWCVYQRMRQSKKTGSSLFLDYLTLQVGVLYSSETLVTIYQLTWCIIRVDLNLSQHRCQPAARTSNYAAVVTVCFMNASF